MENDGRKDSDLEMVDDTNQGAGYVKDIVHEYNQLPDKWEDIDKKIFFAVSKNEVQTNEKRCVIYIRNFADLYELKFNLINAFLSLEKKVYIRTIDQTIMHSAEKLQVPTKLLSDIFDKFAKNFRLTNKDFKLAKLKYDYDKDNGTLKNTHFIYFCLTIACTMSRLLGKDGVQSDDFKQNIEKLFNDKTICPGFLSIVGKLANFNKFCFLCDSIDKVDFECYDTETACYEGWRFADFKGAVKKSGLKLLDLLGQKISKVETKKLKIENTNSLIQEKNIATLNSFSQKIGQIETKELKIENTNSLIQEKNIATLNSFSQKIGQIETKELKIENTNSLIKEKNIATLKLKNQKKVLIWKNLILVLSIALSALISVLSGLNIKFFFIAFITNPLSIILTVGSCLLFLGLVCIAYKTDTIRLSKLCCVKYSNGKSFFNLYQNVGDKPNTKRIKTSLKCFNKG